MTATPLIGTSGVVPVTVSASKNTADKNSDENSDNVPKELFPNDQSPDGHLKPKPVDNFRKRKPPPPGGKKSIRAAGKRKFTGNRRDKSIAKQRRIEFETSMLAKSQTDEHKTKSLAVTSKIVEDDRFKKINDLKQKLLIKFPTKKYHENNVLIGTLVQIFPSTFTKLTQHVLIAYMLCRNSTPKKNKTKFGLVELFDYRIEFHVRKIDAKYPEKKFALMKRTHTASRLTEHSTYDVWKDMEDVISQTNGLSTLIAKDTLRDYVRIHRDCLAWYATRVELPPLQKSTKSDEKGSLDVSVTFQYSNLEQMQAVVEYAGRMQGFFNNLLGNEEISKVKNACSPGKTSDYFTARRSVLLGNKAAGNDAPHTVTFTTKDSPYTHEEARIEFSEQIRILWRIFQCVNEPTEFHPFTSNNMTLKGLEPLLVAGGELFFPMFLCHILDCHFLCKDGTLVTDYSEKLIVILLGIHDKVIRLFGVRVTLLSNEDEVGKIEFTRNDEGGNAFQMSIPLTDDSKKLVFFYSRWYGRDLLKDTFVSSKKLYFKIFGNNILNQCLKDVEEKYFNVDEYLPKILAATRFHIQDSLCCHDLAICDSHYLGDESRRGHVLGYCKLTQDRVNEVSAKDESRKNLRDRHTLPTMNVFYTSSKKVAPEPIQDMKRVLDDLELNHGEKMFRNIVFLIDDESISNDAFPKEVFSKLIERFLVSENSTVYIPYTEQNADNCESCKDKLKRKNIIDDIHDVTTVEDTSIPSTVYHNNEWINNFSKNLDNKIWITLVRSKDDRSEISEIATNDITNKNENDNDSARYLYYPLVVEDSVSSLTDVTPVDDLTIKSTEDKRTDDETEHYIELPQYYVDSNTIVLEDEAEYETFLRTPLSIAFRQSDKKVRVLQVPMYGHFVNSSTDVFGQIIGITNVFEENKKELEIGYKVKPYFRSEPPFEWVNQSDVKTILQLGDTFTDINDDGTKTELVVTGYKMEDGAVVPILQSDVNTSAQVGDRFTDNNDDGTKTELVTRDFEMKDGAVKRHTIKHTRWI